MCKPCTRSGTLYIQRHLVTAVVRGYVHGGMTGRTAWGVATMSKTREKLGAALLWRESYAKLATLCEAQGNAIDARQARIKVQLLE
jgi:predicted amidohydrolase YtcJ